MKFKLLLLPLLSVAALAANSTVDYKDHLGIQLWSLREAEKESITKALDLAKSYGLTEIETHTLGKLTAEELAAEMKSRGLTAVGMHTGYDSLKKDLPGIIATAKTLGVKYIICPWIGRGKEPFDEPYARSVAKDFEAFGKTVSEAGLKLGIHPHGFEFVPSSKGNGETLFDVIAQETSPEHVVFELDVFWAFHAGQDPVALLKKYGKRWALMHVKDIRKGAVTHLSTGSAPPTDNVAVGTGQIDWPAVLKTAQDVGTQHFLIEDETPAPLQNIPASVKYLRDLKL